MTRGKFLLSIISGALLLSGSLFGADKPNLTGEWKLLIDKSDFGPMPPPNTQTLKIDHKDPDIIVTTDQDGMQGQISYTMKCKTDGVECVNEIRGAQSKTIAKWDGEALIMATKLDFQGMEIAINNSSKISAEGKMLTQTLKITTPQGELESKQVYEKVQK